MVDAREKNQKDFLKIESPLFKNLLSQKDVGEMGRTRVYSCCCVEALMCLTV